MKVVVDCANGSAYKTTPWLLRELGASVISINDSPNGTNINENCGSLHMDRLAKEVLKNRADLGIAHDGDADRVLFCDEKGRLVDGDQIMGICALNMDESGCLKERTLVATVMSNMGLEVALKRRGIKMLRTRVGDRYVVEKMISGRYNLGGEQSGHIIFLDHNTTGDGPITAVQVLNLMKETGRKLSKLISPIKLFPQVLINVEVEKKPDMRSVPEIELAVKRAEEQLAGRGRVLVRPSGTEPKIRVMLEGEDRNRILKLGRDIAKVIKEKMA
jgi:phosphoglucosamine mutase